MGYGEYLEWLSSSGYDVGSYADNAINPLKDHQEEEDDCDMEEDASDD